jgi:hypothetical protein
MLERLWRADMPFRPYGEAIKRLNAAQRSGDPRSVGDAIAVVMEFRTDYRAPS